MEHLRASFFVLRPFNEVRLLQTPDTLENRAPRKAGFVYQSLRADLGRLPVLRIRTDDGVNLPAVGVGLLDEQADKPLLDRRSADLQDPFCHRCSL